MKLLLCPNLSSSPYSRDESLVWLNEIAFMCRQSRGVIDACIAIERGHRRIIDRVSPSIRSELFDTINASTFEKIRKEIYHFDAIFVNGRNQEVEQAAQHLNILHLSIGKSPWPLDVWHVESGWPIWDDARGDDASPSEMPAAGTAFLGTLPLSASEYGRYAPCTGKAAEFLYARARTCVLLPIYDHHRLTSQSPLQRVLGEIRSLTQRYRDLWFLVVPMSRHADKLEKRLCHTGPNIVWLSKPDGRRQALSLTQKADAVLALDATAALLPLMMGKPVYRVSDCSDNFLGTLPKLENWLNSADSADEILWCCHRLARKVLAHHIIPKHHGPLLRYQKMGAAGPGIQVNDPVFWNACLDFEGESRMMRRPTAPALVRKLRKLRNDPFAFCNDSRIPLIRMLRIMFKPGVYRRPGPDKG